jgi:hypothetical protein
MTAGVQLTSIETLRRKPDLPVITPEWEVSTSGRPDKVSNWLPVRQVANSDRRSGCTRRGRRRQTELRTCPASKPVTDGPPTHQKVGPGTLVLDVRSSEPSALDLRPCGRPLICPEVSSIGFRFGPDIPPISRRNKKRFGESLKWGSSRVALEGRLWRGAWI